MSQQRMVMLPRVVFEPLFDAAEAWINAEHARLAAHGGTEQDYSLLGRATKALEMYQAQRRIAGD